MLENEQVIIGATNLLHLLNKRDKLKGTNIDLEACVAELPSHWMGDRPLFSMFPWLYHLSSFKNYLVSDIWFNGGTLFLSCLVSVICCPIGGK